MKEIWKDVIDYEGQYEISDSGQVRSLNYNRTGKTRLLKPRKNSDGYLLVTLYKDGKTKQFYVHRLVAQAFIANPQNWPEVNHRDENPLNNHVSNLEWCSHKYNLTYGTCQKRKAAKLKGKFVNGPCAKQILQYDKDKKLVKIWPSTMEIKRQLGFHASAICMCCRGKRESAYGFLWRYV